MVLAQMRCMSCCLKLQKLRSWMTDPEHTYIVGAGTYPGSDKDKQDGIYFGHAYAVVGVAFPPVSLHVSRITTW